MQPWQWVVWTAGVLLFAAVIIALIVAVVRAGRRPPQLHSAAERLQRQAPLDADVETQLRELAGLQQQGRISDADYEQRRAEVLRRHR